MLAILLENQGQYEQGQVLATESHDVFRQINTPAWEALALQHRGVLAFGMGDMPSARRFLEDALARQRHLPAFFLPSTANDLGVVLQAQGEFVQAEDLFREALTQWVALGAREGIADALANLATLRARQGQVRLAARLFGAAHALADAIHYPFELPERTEHQRARQTVEARLGTEAFMVEWQHGAALSLDDLLAAAHASDAAESRAGS